MDAFPLHANGVDLSLDELLVYRAYGQRQNPFRAMPRASARAGQNLTRLKGRGMEFDEVRRYQSGDDVRTIDWRVTARTGAAHTKLFREERERPVLIFTDLGNQMQQGSALVLKSVQAAHLAALIGWQTVAAGERIGGIICREGHHHEHKPRARRQGISPYLESLVELHKQPIQPESDQDQSYLHSSLLRLRRLAHPGSVVLIISDGQQLVDAELDLLADIARHCEVRLFEITDPLAQRLAQCPKSQIVPVWHQGKLAQLDHQGRMQWLNAQDQQQLRLRKGLSQRGLKRSQVSAAKRLDKQMETLWQPIL